jgi:hypothetical protein
MPLFSPDPGLSNFFGELQGLIILSRSIFNRVLPSDPGLVWKASCQHYGVSCTVLYTSH